MKERERERNAMMIEEDGGERGGEKMGRRKEGRREIKKELMAERRGWEDGRGGGKRWKFRPRDEIRRRLREEERGTKGLQDSRKLKEKKNKRSPELC